MCWQVRLVVTDSWLLLRGATFEQLIQLGFCLLCQHGRRFQLWNWLITCLGGGCIGSSRSSNTKAWHTSDGGWLSFLAGCFWGGCWFRFGNMVLLLLEVIDLVLKAKVLCRCFIGLFGRFPFVVFKLCFQLDKPGLFNCSLLFILLFRGSYGIRCMFYSLRIGGSNSLVIRCLCSAIFWSCFVFASALNSSTLLSGDA